AERRAELHVAGNAESVADPRRPLAVALHGAERDRNVARATRDRVRRSDHRRDPGGHPPEEIFEPIETRDAQALDDVEARHRVARSRTRPHASDVLTSQAG